MANRVFQSVIMQLKEATDRTIGVIDPDGTVVACSDTELLEEHWAELALKVSGLPDTACCADGKTFKTMVNGGGCLEYLVFVSGEDETARSLCIAIFVAMSNAKSYYEEKHDRATLVKNIILDNILPGDIYARAKELHFSLDANRAVFLIRQQGGRREAAAVDVLQGLFPDRLHDFVLNVNDSDIVLVKQMGGQPTAAELMQIAQSAEDILKSELFIKTVIGIGTVADHLRDLADSYKEAQTAIAVGKVFEAEKTILNYENLGLGRLIYQLPTTLCEIFLTEVFKMNTIESLDQETLFTIDTFFENNLNVSETSRKLFVHRNTLVYRLDKIKKLTGLDLRLFDHAIVFKVALMVRKYLASRRGESHLA